MHCGTNHCTSVFKLHMSIRLQWHLHIMSKHFRPFHKRVNKLQTIKKIACRQFADTMLRMHAEVSCGDKSLQCLYAQGSATIAMQMDATMHDMTCAHTVENLHKCNDFQ